MITTSSLTKLSKAALPAVLALGFVTIGGVHTNSSYAAGDGGGTTVVKPKCKKNKIWDKDKKKCVKAEKSSGLSDDSIYEAGRDLAYLERFEEALAVLNLASNQNDPRILNFLGYSTRKLGNVESGLVFYQAAIKADPNYTLARSYMGEAYLQLGDRKNALNQLAEIEKRCGIGCAEYAALKTQIDGNPAPKKGYSSSTL